MPTLRSTYNAERDCRSRHNRWYIVNWFIPMEQLTNNRFVVWSVEEDHDRPLFIDGKFIMLNSKKRRFHKDLDGRAIGGMSTIFH